MVNGVSDQRRNTKHSFSKNPRNLNIAERLTTAKSLHHVQIRLRAITPLASLMMDKVILSTELLLVLANPRLVIILLLRRKKTTVKTSIVNAGAITLLRDMKNGTRSYARIGNVARTRMAENLLPQLPLHQVAVLVPSSFLMLKSLDYHAPFSTY